jgi:hypothetical protein
MTPDATPTDLTWLYWMAAGLIAVLALFLFIVVSKGRRLPGAHVFQASRLSRGNRLLPAQVVVSNDSITLYQPQWIGKIEESIHISHVSSIKIDTNLVFSDVFIETTGGRNPIVCHGHTKGDAIEMKKLIEKLQSERYGRGEIRTT